METVKTRSVLTRHHPVLGTRFQWFKRLVNVLKGRKRFQRFMIRVVYKDGTEKTVIFPCLEGSFNTVPVKGMMNNPKIKSVEIGELMFCSYKLTTATVKTDIPGVEHQSSSVDPPDPPDVQDIDAFVTVPKPEEG